MILEAVILMTLLGLIFGFILAYAAKRLAIKIDDRLHELIRALPGVNCGACGYPSCKLYAEAVYNKKAALNLCKVGKEPTMKKLTEIMDK